MIVYPPFPPSSYQGIGSYVRTLVEHWHTTRELSVWVQSTLKVLASYPGHPMFLNVIRMQRWKTWDGLGTSSLHWQSLAPLQYLPLHTFLATGLKYKGTRLQGPEIFFNFFFFNLGSCIQCYSLHTFFVRLIFVLEWGVQWVSLTVQLWTTYTYLKRELRPWNISCIL